MLKKIKTKRSAIILLTFLGITFLNGQRSTASITWGPKASMASAQGNGGTGVLGGYIYTVGGFDASGVVTKKVSKYDPLNDVWTSVTDLPVALSGLAVGVVGNYMFAIGGRNSAGIAVSTVYMYDPINLTWTTKTPMNVARYNLAAAVIGGYIYTVGGTDGTNALKTVERYDPYPDIYTSSSPIWKTLSDMPTARFGLSLTLLGGKLFAVGGSGATRLTTVEVFDPSYSTSLGTWSSTVAAQYPGVGGIQNHSSGVINGVMYIIGGIISPGSTTTAQVYAYHLNTNIWTLESQMSNPRYSSFVGVLCNKCYVVGGNTSNTSTSIKNESFTDNTPSTSSYPCSDVLLQNTDFEQFLNGIAPNPFLQPDENDIPGWKTTASDFSIEIWNGNTSGTPAYSGNYFAELNSTSIGTFYQTFSVTGPTTLSIGFAHRGRYVGNDVMEVLIGPDGGPYTSLGQFSDNKSGGNTPPYVNGWRHYNVTYAPPVNTLGLYRIQFKTVSVNNGLGDPNTHKSDGGNFLDSITVTCASDFLCPPTCDTAYFTPYSIAGVQIDYKTVHVVNRTGIPIAYIDLSYYDCANGTPITNANPIAGGGVILTRYSTSTNTSGGSLYNSGLITPYRRVPNNYSSTSNTFPVFSGSKLQTEVMFNLGFNWFGNVPTTWCIHLKIHHTDSTVCDVVMPSWTPSQPSNNHLGVGIGALDPHISGVRLDIDPKGYPSGTLGFLSVTVEDSTDKIVGASGAPWLSRLDSSENKNITNSSLSNRGALFSIEVDTSNTTPVNLFIAASGDGTRKPKVNWNLCDKEGKILSSGSAQTSSIVNIVNPPIANPNISDVFINSIVPNPGSSTMTFTYTLGANEDSRLELFNTLGQSVALLSDGFQTQGEHQSSFNVVALAEGTYYLRLTTRFGKATAIVKVIH